MDRIQIRPYKTATQDQNDNIYQNPQENNHVNPKNTNSQIQIPWIHKAEGNWKFQQSCNPSLVKTTQNSRIKKTHKKYATEIW